MNDLLLGVALVAMLVIMVALSHQGDRLGEKVKGIDARVAAIERMFSPDGRFERYKFYGEFDFTSAQTELAPIMKDLDGDGVDEPYTMIRCPESWERLGD